MQGLVAQPRNLTLRPVHPVDLQVEGGQFISGVNTNNQCRYLYPTGFNKCVPSAALLCVGWLSLSAVQLLRHATACWCWSACGTPPLLRCV